MQEQTIRQHEQRAWPLPDDCRECVFDLFPCAYPRDSIFIPNAWAAARISLLLDHLYRAGRIPEDGDVGELGNHFPEQLQPFPFHFRRDRGQPRDVPAGPREARDEARSRRVANGHHDERNRRCRLLDGERGGCASGNDHINFQGDQFGDEGRKAFILSFRPSILDQNVLALDVAEVPQAFAERPDEYLPRAAGVVPRKPNRGTFAGCCASVGRLSAKSKVLERKTKKYFFS